MATRHGISNSLPMPGISPLLRPGLGSSWPSLTQAGWRGCRIICLQPPLVSQSQQRKVPVTPRGVRAQTPAACPLSFPGLPCPSRSPCMADLLFPIQPPSRDAQVPPISRRHPFSILCLSLTPSCPPPLLPFDSCASSRQCASLTLVSPRSSRACLSSCPVT